MDAANTVREARATWVSPFQFEPSGGGLGITLSATTTSGTSSRTALAGSGQTVRIVNDGSVTACVAFGDSTVVATTNYLRVLPGVPETFSLPDADSVTHAAAITVSGSTSVHITRGHGG